MSIFSKVNSGTTLFDDLITILASACIEEELGTYQDVPKCLRDAWEQHNRSDQMALEPHTTWRLAVESYLRTLLQPRDWRPCTCECEEHQCDT